MDVREQHASLLKSPWDLAKCLVGAGLVAIGVSSGYSVYNEVEDEFETEHKVGIGFHAVLSLLGAYITYKGLMRSTAKSRIAAAEKVVDEIDKVLVSENCL